MNVAGDTGGDFDADFDEFQANGGDVEVGDSNLASTKGKDGEGDPEPPKRPLTGAAKAARDAKEAREAAAAKPDANEGDEEGDEDEDGEEDENGKKRRAPSDRIRELTKRARTAERNFDTLRAEIEALKNPAGQKQEPQDKYAALGPKPNPQDEAKYPLGHLDEKYVEDAMDWKVAKTAIDQADAALQRQQEQRQNQSREKEAERIQSTIETLSTKGEELHDDFRELVVDGGMKGEWDLGQPTFEAAAEVDHGATILYNLANDTKEATRVANLSARQQILYVEAQNAEIEAKTKGRKIPRAGEPAATRVRGTNGSKRIDPGTENLDDFEKAWEADAKGK